MRGATCFRHQEGAAQVHRHHSVPYVHVDLGELLLGKRRVERGVVDQHIDLPEARHGR
jgi:hypothetical protein